MSLDIMSEICFGYSFDSQKTELNPFLVAVVRVGEGGLSLMSQTILKFLPFMWYMPFGPANKLSNVTKISTKVLDEVQFLFYNLFFFFYFFDFHLYFQCLEQIYTSLDGSNFWKTNKTDLLLKIRFSIKRNLSKNFVEMHRFKGSYKVGFWTLPSVSNRVCC